MPRSQAATAVLNIAHCKGVGCVGVWCGVVWGCGEILLCKLAM